MSEYLACEPFRYGEFAKVFFPGEEIGMGDVLFLYIMTEQFALARVANNLRALRHVLLTVREQPHEPSTLNRSPE